MRDSDAERQTLERLRGWLAASPDAALIVAVVQPLGPEGRPWVQCAALSAGIADLAAVARELTQMAEERQAEERTPRPALRLPYRDD